MGRGAKPQYENGRGLSSRAPFLGMFYGPFVNACSVARTLQRARVAGTGFKVPEPSAPSEGFLQTKDALPSGRPFLDPLTWALIIETFPPSLLRKMLGGRRRVRPWEGRLCTDIVARTILTLARVWDDP